MPPPGDPVPETGIEAYDQGDYDWLIGTDECGYGAWAGDLVVGMVAVPRGWTPTVPIGDSKKLTELARERAYDALLKDHGVYQQVHSVSSAAVDRVGVYKLLIMTHEAAIRQARQAIVDKHGTQTRIASIADGSLPLKNAVSLPKADAKIPAVSAASIIAKVWRDREMVRLAKEYPGYGFETNRGYGGNEAHAHTIALEKLGPCPIHRRSFAPVARCLERKESVTLPWEEFCNE